ncbi:MAG TPA: hypothetical protein VHB27_11230 [Rhodopila sp.]|uniref:hypothetical protein n=1 Tax=Rhodopila sp. TaxID=2480087 RepID=UPI002C4DF7BE|nr:hypothetical protein [Rhodopila sp.]HVY15794.1 hypothetical protein [Rhodopila sp.]
MANELAMPDSYVKNRALKDRIFDRVGDDPKAFNRVGDDPRAFDRVGDDPKAFNRVGTDPSAAVRRQGR